ncbi:hypothetical protein CAP35_10510 [Chitinophagaceae bacterium IBVUCB1]|nr:hypothetical protein CAP35_10510 [Chitinophagaceae bacterium IBVUCB1]
MSKETFYRVIIVSLLLLNLGVLAYLWMGRDAAPQDMGRYRQGEPAPFIIKSLQLDEAQQVQFDGLRDKHQHNTRQLREESKQLHDALFKLLHDEVVDSTKTDSLMLLISANNRAKEMVNFNHFRELKTILKPEQYKLYDEFIESIARRFGPPPHPHHDKRH